MRLDGIAGLSQLVVCHYAYVVNMNGVIRTYIYTD